MAGKSRSELNTLIDKPYKKGNENLQDKLKAIEVANSAIVAKAGSVCYYQQLN